MLAVGRSAGRVQLLDGSSGAPIASWLAAAADSKGAKAAASGDSDSGAVVGLHFLGQTSGSTAATAGDLAASLKVLSVTSSGRVCVHATAAGVQAPWEQISSFQAAPSVAATVSCGLH